jgi:hypothetical protein
MGHRVRLTPDGSLIEPEASLLSKVMAYAHMRQWHCWHDRATNAARRCYACGAARRGPRNAPGLPDLLLVRRPRLVVAELKRVGEEPTPAQWGWLREFAACGIETYIWTTSADDWEDVKRILL